MALHIVSLMRNEASRFLPRILPIWSEIADELLVVNDASTDATRDLCEEAGAEVIDVVGYEGPAWGQESSARALLFESAWKRARIEDYILILDADMIPARDPKTLMAAEADAVSFILFDLWATEPLKYREDAFWRGHLTPRIWMVRKTTHDVKWEWSPRGIHTGHLPLNYRFESHIYAPRDYGLLHYAYSTPELRDEKYVAYASVASQLTDHEIAHVKSIRDPDPETYALDFTPEWTL